MAQPPYKVDQLQIEAGTTTFGTRIIDRDPVDGGLRFSDPNVTASLAALVGLRNVTGLYLVAQGGDGAPYTTIRDAIDAIPDTSSSTDPSLIVVLGGVYSENLVIDKDGVFIVGLGGVAIINAAADATISIVDAPTTTPRLVRLQGLIIQNTTDAKECVLVEGAGTYASGTVTVNTAPLAAGDTVAVGGVFLVGVNGARTSGSDNFSVDGGTASSIAAEIMLALNDPANSFTSTVATYLGSIVTITALTPGAGGNAISLAVNTTPPGGMAASGAFLAGGGSADSEVAYQEVGIIDCDLLASGNGGYQVRADTVNNVRIQGGTWRGSSSTSEVMVTNCAALRVFGVGWTNDFQLLYNTGNDQPARLTSEYAIQQCGRVGDILSSQTGLGSLSVDQCPVVGNVVQGGDQVLSVSHSSIGALTLAGTVAASLAFSTRGVATTAGGSPTLAESLVVDVAPYAGVPLIVFFPVAQPDTNYAVLLSPNVLVDTYAVTAKTTASFTIDAAAATPATVDYTVMRQM